MSFIKERSNFSNIIKNYRLQNISNIEEAAYWLCNVKDLAEIDTDFVYLWDTVNRFDEGNTNLQLDPDVSLETIVNELSNREIDYILIYAEFEEKPVVIGVDLRDYTVTVTLSKKKMANIEKLEKLLSLND